MLLIIILMSAGISIIEGIPLIKKKLWKEFSVLIFILTIAVFLVVEDILGIPTPIEITSKFLNPLGKAIFRQ